MSTTTQREAIQKSLDFLEFAWRDISMNDYAEAKRAEAEDACYKALDELDTLQLIVVARAALTDDQWKALESWFECPKNG